MTKIKINNDDHVDTKSKVFFTCRKQTVCYGNPITIKSIQKNERTFLCKLILLLLWQIGNLPNWLTFKIHFALFTNYQFIH